MLAFHSHTGKVLPLDQKNVDTDQIIPKQYLLRVTREGFGDNLFDDRRYLDPGEPDTDHSRRRINPDFILNQPRYAGSGILLTRDNFGCGSSREHAVWALMQYGFRVIIAESYSDIFAGNAWRNGLLLITLSKKEIEELFTLESSGASALRLKVDLRQSTISQVVAEGRSPAYHKRFTVDPQRRESLLEGLDDIGETLAYSERIGSFEQRYYQRFPWLKTPNKAT